ncbi:M48 family metallopeptidase [Gracilimonas mengyeensis]|uniref:YgjP-like metallopeptidase domain-containing protein n=1 Tax=Gracilimonas mengyeensis TaxID=1302730 RepID=A0A521BJF3_9BACT|nr:SprT family zinc-dependent metalloprotease [Gracilimonas mengyeensis]SMO47212.1 hypothetical protein SAMN06265219_102322 [Gracilimonas mengyeensis]
MSRGKIYSKYTIAVKDLQVEVRRKNVKNLNLRVYPSKQQVRLSIPRRATLAHAEGFITQKYSWIKQKLLDKPAKKKITPKTFEDGETHYVSGRAFTLNIVHSKQSQEVLVDHETDTLHLSVPAGSSAEKKERVLTEWYRAELKKQIPGLINKWEKPMGVRVNEFGVKQMKTRWGSCNIRQRRIWLNLELAKKSPELLEYVVVHEMTHLLERLHSKRFYQIMEKFLPNWKQLEVELNGRFRIRNC